MNRINRRLFIATPLAVALAAFAHRHGLAQSATPEAVAPELPATVTDVTGAEVTVSDISRIVPLSGDISEIVWAIGLGERIAAIDVSTVYPAELMEKGLPNIGFERALSAEGILSVSPTVVIGKEQAGPPETLAQIRSAGVPVVIISEPQTLEAPGLKIREVGAALGIANVAEALAHKVEREIETARSYAATATSKPRVMLLYLRGEGTQLIGGAGVVSEAMIVGANAIDAGAETGIQGFSPVTAEAIVAASPDFILVPARGIAQIGGVAGVMEIPGVAQTAAADSGQIIPIDDVLLLSMSPRTGQALAQLVAALHPEIADQNPFPPVEASPVASLVAG